MLSFQTLSEADRPLLWPYLHMALWSPPPLAALPQAPAAVHIADWGSPFDCGALACHNGEAAGACWLSLLPDACGLAFVDVFTPQLQMAVLPPHRGQGVGRRLLDAVLQQAMALGYQQVALAVHPDSPALRFYRQAGFRTVTLRQYHHVMLRSLP